MPSPITGLRRPFEMERLPNPATGFSGDRHWYEYDGSNSVVGLADESGDLVRPYLYDEYGFPLVANWELQFFAYVGLGYDVEIGLYSSPWGYYDPVRGIYWLTGHQHRPVPLTDPIGLLMGLLPLLSVISPNKRKRRRYLLLLIGVLILAAISLIGCNGGTPSPPSPALLPTMPTTGAEPPYEPDRWNGSDIQFSNNCYSYAVDDQRIHRCSVSNGTGLGLPLVSVKIREDIGSIKHNPVRNVDDSSHRIVNPMWAGCTRNSAGVFVFLKEVAGVDRKEE